MSQSRLRRLPDGRYEYTPKKGVAFTLTAEALVRRLVALLPPPNRHLTSFHGVYAPNARLRSTVTQSPEPMVSEQEKPKKEQPKKGKRDRTKPPRLDWASLHQHTFGHDVLRCLS